MGKTELDKLEQLMRASGVSALAINPGPTLTHLTGMEFHIMERPVVLLLAPPSKAALVFPELETLKVNEAAIDLAPFPYPDDPAAWQDAFNQASNHLSLKGKTIGVEPTCLRYLEYGYVSAAAPEAKIIAAADIFSELRSQKSAVELDRMRKAVRIAEKAFVNLLPLIHEGMTEREIAAELTIQLYRAGSDVQLPFNPIVAAGENGANPHAVPSDRRIARGDLIVIDWGARAQGYISDLTRMVAVGTIDSQLEHVLSIVQEANQAGRDACNPGRTPAEVDQATRRVIAEAGFGDQFTHRTGHGIGLEAHEAPYIHAGNTEPLLPGMTFTIEPGIYLPGNGGARIEDNIVITPDGREDLSTLSRELFYID